LQVVAHLFRFFGYDTQLAVESQSTAKSGRRESRSVAGDDARAAGPGTDRRDKSCAARSCRFIGNTAHGGSRTAERQFVISAFPKDFGKRNLRSKLPRGDHFGRYPLARMTRPLAAKSKLNVLDFVQHGDDRVLVRGLHDDEIVRNQ
jgi:hypothetical protein